jgi:hypothetical protein
MSTRDLGSVTSYAMAVALGFEGTEAEWVTFMMEAGDNAASAAASAASASASATSAEASAETARINYGSPLAASTLSGMTEQNRVYVYTGVEQGMVYGDWYYYDGTGWVDGGVYNATAEGQGLTDNERALILSLFSKAAYAEDDAGDAYDQLSALWSVYSVTWSGTDYTHGNTSVSARGGSTFVSTVTADGGHTISTVVVTMGGTTVQGAYNNGVVTISNVLGDIVITVTTIQAEVSSISAVYTQSGTVYETDSLDSLKSDLVVTAHYTDSTSEEVTTYTLSGTLSVGTSTVTVSYGGKTTTFNVTVSAVPTVSSISATYTQSGTVYDTDSLDSLKTDLVVTATWSDSTTSTVASSDYTLSGTLTEGTSTVTVTYEGKTTTFTVTVSESRVPSGYTAYDYITIVSTSKANIKNRGIKTNIQLSPTYQLETKVKYPSGQTHTESTCLMGTRTSQSGTKPFGLFVKPSENKLGYWFGGTDTATRIVVVADSVNTIKVKPVGKSTDYPNNAVIEVDGTEYSTGSTQGSGTWPSWFGLMQYQISATALNGYDAWSSLIQQGEIIIKDYLNNMLYDFIPASNGTIYGFYEAVNDIFYYDETYFAEYACGNWE